MMKLFLRLAGVILATALVGAQAMTNVVPSISNFNPVYGGGAGSSITITGTGFLTATKATRFVDDSGNDVFAFVSCSTTTSCMGSVRPGLKAPGVAGTINVHALTSGGTSGAAGFIYYGPPTVSSLSPSQGPWDSATAYNINGAAFTSSGTGFPGTTSVYQYTSIVDHGGGCATTSLCAASAPSINECCAAQGARWPVSIITPGGSTIAYFLYGNNAGTGGVGIPNTPTITSVTPNGGPAAGGNTITITGTNFMTGTQAGTSAGVKTGTTFNFITQLSTNAGTSNCASTTSCTVVVPASNAGTMADIQVQTVCATGTMAAPCSNNQRPSASIPTTRTAAYVYAGIRTNPAPGLFGGGPFLYTSENGAATSFTVVLTTQPTAAVHVAAAVSPAGMANLSTTGLDFTTANWSTPQTITVTGLDDAGTIGNQQYNVNLTGSSTDLNYNSAFASSPGIINVDNDSKQLMISPQAGLVTTRSGGTATFTVVLSRQPSATVTVNLLSNDTTLGTVSTGSLTFLTTPGGGTGWNVPRTVTITGQSDSQVGTPRTYSILVTLSSADTTYGDVTTFWPDVQVTNQDAAPVITANPTNQTVAPGATATFTAAATGTPSPTVQWQVAANGSGAPFIDIAGATSTTLSFTTSLLDNGEQYRAVFANAGGTTTTTTASLTVTSPPVAPTITLNPLTTLTVLTGQAIFLSANATGSPVPTSQWQVSANGGGTWNNIFGATSFNLSFTTARSDNTKLYRAMFTNSQGTAITNSTLLSVLLRVRSDIDNDRKSDIVVWRPGSGTWFWLTSSSSFNYASQGQKQWGSAANNDIPISADMDGDGIMDLIVWRPTDGTFYWLTSSSGYNYANQQNKQWGNSAQGDKPFVGDIDGDGKGDLIVWRPSSGTWFYLLSSFGYNYANQGQKQWGNSGLGDIPMLGDFDGDGLADLTVWRASSGMWFWLKSSTNYDVNQFGQQQWGNNGLGDIPMVADMDGDGMSDIVVWRPTDGNFYWLRSTQAYNTATPGVKQWGSQANGDIPMLGDIDGDGMSELIVWRPASGTWFWLTSASGYSYAAQQQKQWGSAANNDIPMMK